MIPLKNLQLPKETVLFILLGLLIYGISLQNIPAQLSFIEGNEPNDELTEEEGREFNEFDDAEQLEEEDADADEMEIPRPSVNEVYKFLRDKFPEAYKELQLAQNEDPVEDFMEALERATNFVVQYMEIALEDPKAAELFLTIQKAELKAFDIADRYFEAESLSQRRRLENELKNQISRLVDAQLKEQEYELEVFKKEVAILERFLKDKKRNKNVLVQELLEDFLSEDYEGEDEEDEDFEEGEFDDGDEEGDE